MDHRLKCITKLPLEELWDANGPVEAEPLAYLGAESIRLMLRRGPVRFVVADVGARLLWIDAAKSHSFWKSEVRDHLAEGNRFELEDYPGAYAYSARSWHPTTTGPPIVVLEKHH